MHATQSDDIAQHLEQLIKRFLDLKTGKTLAEQTLKILTTIEAQNNGYWFGAARGYTQLAQQAQDLKAKLDPLLMQDWDLANSTRFLDELRAVADQSWEKDKFTNVFFSELLKSFITLEKDFATLLAVTRGETYIAADEFRIILNRELAAIKQTPESPAANNDMQFEGGVAEFFYWMYGAFTNEVSDFLHGDDDIVIELKNVEREADDNTDTVLVENNVAANETLRM